MHVRDAHLFIAAKISGELLVLWCAVVIAFVEIKWQRRRSLLYPFLIVSPSLLQPRLPGAPNRTEGHRPRLIFPTLDGMGRIFEIRQGKAIDSLFTLAI